MGEWVLITEDAYKGNGRLADEKAVVRVLPCVCRRGGVGELGMVRAQDVPRVPGGGVMQLHGQIVKWKTAKGVRRGI
jgi:hypothetical protein